VPLDPTHPGTRNARIASEARIAGVIVEGRRHDVGYLAPGVQRLDLDRALDGDDPQEMTAASPGGPAAVLYTSGSTGRPKGICYDESAILERVEHATRAKQICAQDRIFLLSSPSTIAGLRVPLLALLNGATLYCVDPNRVGVDGALRFLEEVRPTAGFAVPSLLRTLLSMPGAAAAFAHSRVLRTGGDVLLASDLALWRSVLPSTCRVLVTLTSTEMPAVFEWIVPADWTSDAVRLPVGRARPGVDFQLVDDAGAPVPPGEAGELVVRSRHLALGSWQDGELVSGPFEVDALDSSVRIFRTGDMVRLRGDGLAEMVGRRDRQVKIRGFRVQPGDVENEIRRCAAVADVAVIGRRRGEESGALVAFVVAAPEFDLAALKAALEARLPAHMLPSRIRLIDAMPQLPGFKNDLAALERLDEEERSSADAAALARAYVEPRTALERALAALWCRVLEVERVGIHDDFFQIGGTSLLMARIVAEANESLHTRISTPQFIQNPTVARLAEAAAIGTRGTGTSRPRVIALRERGRGRPIYLVNAGPYEFGLAGLMPERTVYAIEVPWPLAWRRAAADPAGSSMPGMPDLASPYVEALLQHVEGPCILAGHSMGGVIAFEAAHQLQRRSIDIGLVLLFDSWLRKPAKREAAMQALRTSWRQAARRPAGLFGRLGEAWRPYGWMLAPERLRPWSRIRVENAMAALKLMPQPPSTQSDESGSPVPIKLVKRLNRAATHSYRPRRLDARGVLFRASDPYGEFYQAVDGSQGWANLFRNGLDIVPVEGGHLSMIRDVQHHPSLARAIEASLVPPAEAPKRALQT
jgi:acyl-coenzyme A synthetase/AMP-(fatty) acid ligase/thioesterase domain-containing protein